MRLLSPKTEAGHMPAKSLVEYKPINLGGFLATDVGVPLP